jgi:8-oxo-dGTP pyrophosphatase MutT (NUDIX family)
VERHPELLALLDRCTPAVRREDVWARPIVMSVYVGPEDLPDELVTSIRVVVLVGDDVVVCTNVNGSSHAWPGGRREPGETHAETACREVREETGWIVDPDSLEPIGFMHVFNTGDPLPPYPHPDVLQLVMVGRATERAADEWTDTEGYEISSQLVPLADAHAVITDDEPMCLPFLELLRARA